MRHVRLDVARLAVDDTDLPLAYGDVLVVDKVGADRLEWELQVVFLADQQPARQLCEVTLDLLDGRRLAGQAFLVRQRDRMAVYRGSGTLAGLTVDELG